MALYRNLDGTTPDKGLREVLKWQLSRKRDRAPFTTPRRDNDGRALASVEPHLTWIGHATFVARLGGNVFATDPIWSRRIHTIGRLCAPGVELDACPPL